MSDKHSPGAAVPPARPAPRASLGVLVGVAIAASSTAATAVIGLGIGLGIGGTAGAVGRSLPSVMLPVLLPVLGIAGAFARLGKVEPITGNGLARAGRSPYVRTGRGTDAPRPPTPSSR
ncbi:hypothetical protein SZN_29210 [Streptomyces zinciresistens K42]|uniref:Uncharacterized protein n=1 Tax=Streptomyces zinciresistens K42 TaxID=700597 RepID=G2GJZ9_9ACTN|nr:hypothetical protein [Streptomyces zinciresistens]EGX56172.1 hypothetical protein SZN_29210 [Streptomyces zinciresistens K42]